MNSTEDRCRVYDETLLCNLKDVLVECGYGEFCASFNPLAPRLENWGARVQLLNDPLRATAELFLVGHSVEIARLGAELSHLVEGLCEIGLLRTQNEKVDCQGLVLRPVMGFWYFAERPRFKPAVYFGDDSAALLMRLHEPKRESCLDLCSGPGIQALWAGRQGCRTIGVEVNPVAVAVARLNVAINGLDDRVKIVCGDLFEPVGGQTFDWIVANPPLLPIPKSVPYPFVGNGGPDGMMITRRILKGIPEYLSLRGVAQIIGMCLSDGVLPSAVDEFENFAVSEKLGITMTVISHQIFTVGSHLVKSLALTAAAGDPNLSVVLASEFEASIVSPWQCLCSYFLRVSKRSSGQFELLDLSLEGNSGFWFV